MNKKAVSPLVATILLIAFAIALGLVVMNWGKAYIEEKAEFTAGPKDATACSVVELSVIKVAGKEKACYNPNEFTIDVFVENGPEVNIDKLQARIVGNADVETLDSVLRAPMQKGISAQLKFSYTAGIGEVQQLKLTPVLVLDEGEVACTKKAVVVESIQKC